MPKGILPRGTIFWTILLLVGLFLPLTFGGLGFLSDFGLFTIYASANLMWTLVLGTPFQRFGCAGCTLRCSPSA